MRDAKEILGDDKGHHEKRWGTSGNEAYKGSCKPKVNTYLARWQLADGNGAGASLCGVCLLCVSLSLSLSRV
jgi:hypothetical protein